MKIGIGVTTYNRPEHLKHWLRQLNKHSIDCVIHISEDGGNINLVTRTIDRRKGGENKYMSIKNERKGIAYRKNECLRALKDCDYIFLFDDDCFPIKEGWADFFIKASQESGQQHFMYLKQTPTIKRIKEYETVESKIKISEYNNCAGCMMFLTREVIEKVGAYNPAYGYYGFEHVSYSNRIHAARLTPLGKYTCPAGAGEYIYSLDLDNHLPLNKQLKHEPSMANEIQKVPGYIAENRKIYEQDTQIYIPL